MLQEVLQAERRIRPYIRETPLEYSQPLSAMSDSRVFLKLENLQHTGSFKVRGAMNTLLSLKPEQRARGVITASSGNHGIAVAFGLHELAMQGTIFVPEDASSAKVEAIRRYGADVRFWGSDCVQTEEYARGYAEQHGMIYISPYNDPRVIGGQGTIGVELGRQMGQIDAVLAALGGGGMITGIATYLKELAQETTIIGCSPTNSPVMAQSIRAGRIIDMPSLPTLSDGTAGGVEPGAITFPLCQQLVDDYPLVSEEEIGRAMRLFIETHHMLIEGAAGVALAAFLQARGRFQGKTVVIVLCGANISPEVLKSIL